MYLNWIYFIYIYLKVIDEWMWLEFKNKYDDYFNIIDFN